MLREPFINLFPYLYEAVLFLYIFYVPQKLKINYILVKNHFDIKSGKNS